MEGEPSRPNGQFVPRRQSSGVSWLTTLFIAIVTAIVFFVAGTYSTQIAAIVTRGDGAGSSLSLSSAEEAYSLLRKHYDGDVDTAALADGASRGLTAATGDAYTIYMDKAEAEEFDQQLRGEVSGIGAEIGVRGDQPTILRTLDNSPARAAGVQARDTIVKVGDEITDGYNAAKAAEIIRGEAGTTVKLTVRRGDELKEFTITRAKVSDASVASTVRDGIGILTIRRFDTDTGTLARRAAEKFQSENVKGVIIDMRDNGGGYLDQAQSVAGLWLDNSKTVVSERRKGVETDTLSATGGAPLLADVKTVVLMNSGTASASEIVAGALKDHDKATLIGEKSFGKGSVQQVFDLSDGRKMKITVARWFTPKGVNITEKGIEPDTKVELTKADMDADRDPQLDTALKQF